MQTVGYSHLGESQKQLLDEAAKAMETAYNPYSRFYVGAAVLTQAGDIITGANIENSAYGSTICAERTAILTANAMGHRMFEKMAIIARGEHSDTTEVSGPCGSCRQVLFEFSQISGKDLEIIMSTTKKDRIVVATIGELLPLAFGPRDMGVDVRKYRAPCPGRGGA